MKRAYDTPELEFEVFVSEDIMEISGGGTIPIDEGELWG